VSTGAKERAIDAAEEKARERERDSVCACERETARQRGREGERE